MNHRRSWWKDFLNIWVVLGGLVLAAIFIAILGGMLYFLRAEPGKSSLPTAALTVIPAPTLTSSVVLPVLPPTPTATPEPGLQQQGGPIQIGTYVQISGTGGDGLRLRAEPGKNGALKFLGAESEVFQAKDGPRSVDNLTWWYLVAPYDANRNGWAAANFLTVIQKP